MKKLLCGLSVLLMLSSQAAAGVIGIVSPSSCTDKEAILSADMILRSHDITTKLAPHVFDEYGYLAGTDQHRADDINSMFLDDSVSAVLCVRGGYGSARILDKLSYDIIASHPKPLIGFSDATALINVLLERCGTPTVHGPMLVSLVNDSLKSDYTLTQLLSALHGETVSGDIPMPEGRKLETLIPGQAEGVIMGGNLTLIASLIGTPYELKSDGALLLLEEVGEKPYRIDRMLNQLWQNGLLSRVNGILLGDFVDCENKNISPDTRTFGLDDVLRHYAELSGKPVIKGVPAGHGNDNMYIPLGVKAVMNANEDGTSSVIIRKD